MKYLHIRVVMLLLGVPALWACASNAVHAKESAEQTVTVCDLKNWGEAKVGARMRVEAEYFTDFRHGAFLSNKRCPSKWLRIGFDAKNADQSLSKFDDFIGRHADYYVGRKFRVDVSGIFELDKGRVINSELPPDRQLRIPAHGEISISRVWSFEKPNSHGSR